MTDPQATSEEAVHAYGVPLVAWVDLLRADAIVAAVAHREFALLGMKDYGKNLVKGSTFIDVNTAFG